MDYIILILGMFGVSLLTNIFNYIITKHIIGNFERYSERLMKRIKGMTNGRNKLIKK